MTPPPAIKPTGDEICSAFEISKAFEVSKVLAVMAPATSPSGQVAAIGGEAKRANLFPALESPGFPGAGGFARPGLHRAQPLSKDAGPVKQLLIESAHRGEPLARKFAAFHADDVEPLEAGILAVDETERNDVAAHAADAANHHLRPDPGELMHRGQPADVDKIADLAVTAQRCRGREYAVVADDAIMADMAVVHEVTARPDPRDATAFLCSDVHRHAFANGAFLPDFKPGRLTAIT